MSDQTGSETGNTGTNVASSATSSDAPQWARDAITKANNEAAEYRVKLRDKTNEHTEAMNRLESLSDEKAAAEKDRDAAKNELTKLRIVLEAGVPGEQAASIADRIKGSNEDELKADATALIEQFGLVKKAEEPANNSPAAFDPSQGFGGQRRTSTAEPNSPAAVFEEYFKQHFPNIN